MFERLPRLFRLTLFVTMGLYLSLTAGTGITKGEIIRQARMRAVWGWLLRSAAGQRHMQCLPYGGLCTLPQGILSAAGRRIAVPTPASAAVHSQQNVDAPHRQPWPEFGSGSVRVGSCR
jgi:hypothetical protein